MKNTPFNEGDIPEKLLKEVFTMTVKIKVENRRDWNDLCRDLRKAGFLERVSMNETTLPENAFPVEIPLDISALLKLCENKLVRPHIKMMDYNLTETFKKIKPSLM